VIFPDLVNRIHRLLVFLDGMIYANYDDIHKLTFKYMNLDDAEDKHDDI
jgi:hypothetical protein